MLVPLHVFQGLARFGPVEAARVLETEDDAKFVLSDAGVLPPIEVARMLPHCVGRFPRLARGEFLSDDRAREILRSAMSQQAPHGFSALSPSEAVATFASFNSERIWALREAGRVLEVEGGQHRLDGYFDQACQSNFGRGILSLAAAGGRPRAPQDAIQAAVRAGREQVMPALLVAGMPLAAVMRPDVIGRTPVFLAAQLGQARVFRALRVAGVGPEALMATTGQPGRGRMTPAHCAAKYGHPDVIEELHEGGVSAEALMELDASGWTPALYAAQCGHPAVIGALHNAGVRAEALMTPDLDGTTPAHSAALRGDAHMIAALHKAGVSAKELMKPNKIGKTPADYAAGLNALEVIRALREAGVSPLDLVGGAPRAPRPGAAPSAPAQGPVM